ncbi:MAG: hypothetical protein J5787_09845 [Alphaproteobacteria bacterium]|nr:hypothetical protein [Alphaproteobacteria bacterium]
MSNDNEQTVENYTSAIQATRRNIEVTTNDPTKNWQITQPKNDGLLTIETKDMTVVELPNNMNAILYNGGRIGYTIDPETQRIQILQEGGTGLSPAEINDMVEKSLLIRYKAHEKEGDGKGEEIFKQWQELKIQQEINKKKEAENSNPNGGATAALLQSQGNDRNAQMAMNQPGQQKSTPDNTRPQIDVTRMQNNGGRA